MIALLNPLYGQAIFFASRHRSLSGDGIVRAERLLMLMVLLMFVLPVGIMPASGWYWPIMGYVPPESGCPNLCGGPALPPPHDAMLPGTLQWGYPPVDRARLVYPGCAYGADAFRNHLSFGSSLPFGNKISGFGPAPGAKNATTVKGAPANNTTMNATSAGGLLGWLSSRP